MIIAVALSTPAPSATYFVTRSLTDPPDPCATHSAPVTGSHAIAPENVAMPELCCNISPVSLSSVQIAYGGGDATSNLEMNKNVPGSHWTAMSMMNCPVVVSPIPDKLPPTFGTPKVNVLTSLTPGLGGLVRASAQSTAHT